MSKPFNYEDDHDWDDDRDYKSEGYVYWYGKYYPKEDIDALFKDSSDSNDNNENEVSIGKVLAVLGLAAAVGYGIKKAIGHIKKRKQDNEAQTRSNQNKDKNINEESNVRK